LIDRYLFFPSRRIFFLIVGRSLFESLLKERGKREIFLLREEEDKEAKKKTKQKRKTQSE